MAQGKPKTNAKKAPTKKAPTKKPVSSEKENVVEKTLKESKKKVEETVERVTNTDENVFDRPKMKEEAKKKIEGKKWYILKPQVYLALISFVIDFVIFFVVGLIALAAGHDMSCTEEVINVTASVTSVVFSILELAFIVGYTKYVIDFTHGVEHDWKEPFRFAKDNLKVSILTGLLASLNIFIGSLLLIVPGILAAIGLSFYQYTTAENIKLTPKENLKKTWELTYGHKWEIFVLALSFMGWALLVPLTIGIILIWLVPYMTVTYVLAYEKLKKAA